MVNGLDRGPFETSVSFLAQSNNGVLPLTEWQVLLLEAMSSSEDPVLVDESSSTDMDVVLTASGTNLRHTEHTHLPSTHRQDLYEIAI